MDSPGHLPLCQAGHRAIILVLVLDHWVLETTKVLEATC